MMAADIIPKVELEDREKEQSHIKLSKEDLSSMSNHALLEKMRHEMLKRISTNFISTNR